jgi:hypothetical protein
MIGHTVESAILELLYAALKNIQFPHPRNLILLKILQKSSSESKRILLRV